jgi:hypothetical protein
MRSGRSFSSAIALVLAIALSAAPIATAAPRHDRDDVFSRIERRVELLINKIHRVFTIEPNEEFPTPPKP